VPKALAHDLDHDATYALETWTTTDGVKHIRLSSTRPPAGRDEVLYEFHGRLPSKDQAEAHARARRAAAAFQDNAS
jgi:hypothetical protein